ncbi:unnamed protein product [Notodromas monacha]|uniref:Uncharacterized protein n=1 Tax=Notodromas monacha TaxID=399045 RepID=A0A7R9C246_9CRUS|nr:unnamed protein product [Notodromas monacha]CAG0925022.1 unnamed protein product [Notodromas monacha]
MPAFISSSREIS